MGFFGFQYTIEQKNKDIYMTMLTGACYNCSEPQIPNRIWFNFMKALLNTFSNY